MTVLDNGSNTSPTPGSLRSAILSADNNPGTTITFSVTGTITPITPLPAITADGTIIDNGAGMGDVEINGQNCAGIANGLTIVANNCSILGLSVANFTAASGIYVQGSGDTIDGCFIGTEPNPPENANLANGVGVYVSQATRLTVSYNHIDDNNYNGVEVISSGLVLFESNHIESNLLDGVIVVGQIPGTPQGYTTEFDGNDVNLNGQSGVHLLNSSNNRIGATIVTPGGELEFESNSLGNDGTTVNTPNFNNDRNES